MTPSNAAPLSIVVPFFDEAENVPHLAARLSEFTTAESAHRPVELVLVDDGSTDGTLELLRTHFPGARIAHHENNRGLTAALATGLTLATGELIAWLDSDLTYDPGCLSPLAAAVDGGAAVAVASCYHPDGAVLGVPAWRRMLSSMASRCYRRVTRAPIHTYTCMVRVYRREALAACPPASGGFLGVTESLLRVIRSGREVVEVPAMLRRRKRGQSKMRVLRVGLGHLRLMAAGCGRAWRRPAAGAK